MAEVLLRLPDELGHLGAERLLLLQEDDPEVLLVAVDRGVEVGLDLGQIVTGADASSDGSLLAGEVEEMLRWVSPIKNMTRTATVDVELHGTTIAAGDKVLLLYEAANRDERAFTDPDRFDIHRPTGQSLAFGHGIHFCLGAALARLEGRVVLEEVLERFPDWEVDMAGARMAPSRTDNSR